MKPCPAILAIALAVAMPELASAAGEAASLTMAAAPSGADSLLAGIPALSVKTAPGGGQTYTLTLQILALMTALTLLPAVMLMMTSFTRIVIVLGILRQALGAGQTPPNQVIIGLSLFLTFFVMTPVIDRINTDALGPLRSGQIEAMLLKAADTYEDDVHLAVDALVGLLEPVIIIVMGVFVGFLVLSILLPILSMSRNI